MALWTPVYWVPALLMLAQLIFAERPAAFGLDSLRSLPGWLRWVWLAPGFAALISGRVRRGISRAAGLPRPVLFAGAALLLIGLRCQNFYLGDGYHLIHAIGRGKLWFHWNEPLDILLHALLHRALSFVLELKTAELAYAILSIGAGLAYLSLPGRMADLLQLRGARRTLFVGMMLTCGSTQLFFGYAESYTLCSLALVVYLKEALAHLREGASIARPAVWLGLAACLHPETLSAGLGLAYLVLARSGRVRRFLLASAAFALPIALLVIGLSFAGHGLDRFGTSDSPGGGDAKMFVAWSDAKPPFEHYTMLSAGHAWALLNELLLLSPMLPALLGLLRWKRCGRLESTAFLGLVSLGMLAFVVLWNPDLGPERDWDLFASAGFAFTAFAAATAAASLEERELEAASVALPVISGLLTGASVYGNSIRAMPPIGWRG